MTGTDMAMVSPYWKDLRKTLGRSSNAHALLTAALLWSTSADSESFKRYSELIARAEQAAPDEPLILWIAASQCRESRACISEHTAARKKLIRLDGQNAAVWLLELQAAQQDGDHASAERAMVNAAAAKYYDDYLIKSAAVLSTQMQKHPAPAPVRRLLYRESASSEAFASKMAGGISSTLELPQSNAATRLCLPENDPKQVPDEPLYKECLDLARIAYRGNSIWAIGLAMALEHNLLASEPTAVAAKRRHRHFRWMLAQVPAFFSITEGDSEASRQYREKLYRSNDEPESIATLMTARGIPLDPPADWKTSWQ